MKVILILFFLFLSSCGENKTTNKQRLFDTVYTTNKEPLIVDQAIHSIVDGDTLFVYAVSYGRGVMFYSTEDLSKFFTPAPKQ